MDRFKNVACDLLNVPRKKIANEQRQYDVEKANRKKR
jgi:hypothetical protein